jgi:hypothetical protein
MNSLNEPPLPICEYTKKNIKQDKCWNGETNEGIKTNQSE